MSRILAISGSPRRGGNTDTLLMEMVRGAKSGGARVTTLYLRHYDINSCVGCEQCRGRGFCVRFEDGMSLFYPEIEKCQGLILGSPVYNYNVSAQVKAFIDRLFPYYIFSNDSPREFSSRLAAQNRRAVVYAVGEQKTVRDMALALPAMALPLEALGYDVAHRLIFRGFLNKNEVAAHQPSLRRAYEAGLALAKLVAGAR